MTTKLKQHTIEEQVAILERRVDILANIFLASYDTPEEMIQAYTQARQQLKETGYEYKQH